MTEAELRNLISGEMKSKSEDKVRLNTYKNVLEKAQKIAKESCRDITDTDITLAARKEQKQLMESCQFATNGSDLYIELSAAIEYVNELLPKMATREDITEFVKSNINSVQNMGAMMKMLKDKFGVALDGKLASSIVKDFI